MASGLQIKVLVTISSRFALDDVFENVTKSVRIRLRNDRISIARNGTTWRVLIVRSAIDVASPVLGCALFLLLGIA
jgi:hypothetical protein